MAAKSHRVFFLGHMDGVERRLPVEKRGSLEECREYAERLREMGRGSDIRIQRAVQVTDYRWEDVDERDTVA